MIATLKGNISELSTNLVVIDVNGVGYGVLVTTEDHGRLSIGKEYKLYIYEHIREQSYDLFGFSTIDTKKLFEQLLSVNGVGPKMALNILSIGSTNAVRVAIASGDAKYITGANGVGKRVAERVIIELKDKVGLASIDLESTGLLQGETYAMQDEAVQALVALGYDAVDASKALNGIDTTLPVEARIKAALKARR